jgi:hypothetical protein
MERWLETAEMALLVRLRAPQSPERLEGEVRPIFPLAVAGWQAQEAQEGVETQVLLTALQMERMALRTQAAAEVGRVMELRQAAVLQAL